MQVNPPPPPKKVNWHRESRLTPPYYWIHSQNMWHWDCVLITVEYKGTRVMNRLSLMWRGLLSKWKPILIHTFVSCHSLDDLQNMDFSNKLPRSNVWGKHFKFLGHFICYQKWLCLPLLFDTFWRTFTADTKGCQHFATMLKIIARQLFPQWHKNHWV